MRPDQAAQREDCLPPYSSVECENIEVKNK
jgi:hypothetical protein